MVEGQSGL